MKVTAVIMRPDHHNDIVKLKRKDIKANNFTHNGKKYFLNSEHFQIEETRFGKDNLRYYFKEGVPKPLPVPEFSDEIVNLGVDNEELELLFDRHLVRVLGSLGPTTAEKWLFIVNMGTAAGVVYIIVMLNQLPEKIVQAILGA